MEDAWQDVEDETALAADDSAAVTFSTAPKFLHSFSQRGFASVSLHLQARIADADGRVLAGSHSRGGSRRHPNRLTSFPKSNASRLVCTKI